MYKNLKFNQQEMLCELLPDRNFSAIQVANKNMTCPSHCIRQTLIASEDTTLRRNVFSKNVDLGILGLTNKGVKVCKQEQYETVP